MFDVFFSLSCFRRGHAFEQQDLARRIRVCTPEGAQGETFTHVVFLALQRRHKDESEPAGHSDQAARRLVALTRARRTLVVLGEAMSWKRYTGPTRLLQSELDSSPHRVRLVDHRKAGGTGETRAPAYVSFLFGVQISQAAKRLLGILGLDPDRRIDSSLELASDELCAAALSVAPKKQDIAAADFFTQPNEWRKQWDKLDWSNMGGVRTVPSVPKSAGHPDVKARTAASAY